MKNKKTVSLKQVIFRLSLWLMLYSLVILAITALLNMKQKISSSAEAKLASLENDIYNLRSLKNEFLLLYQQENSEIESLSEIAESGFNQLASSVLIEADDLASLREFRKDSVLSGETELLKTHIRSFAENSKTLFLSVQERGNSISGLISQWTALSTRIADMTGTQNRQAIQKITGLKLMEADFMQTYNSRYLDNILTGCEELQPLFTEKESTEAGTVVSDYLFLTKKIADINKRIKSPSGDSGYNPEADMASSEALKVLASMRRAELSTDADLTTASGYVVIAVFFCLLVWMVYRQSRRQISDPLGRTASYAGKLSAGCLTIPEPGNVIAEIEEVNAKMQNIAAELAKKYEFTKALNGTDFNYDLKVSDNDLLGSELLEIKRKIVWTNEEQARNNEDNMRRRYINEGLAKFAGILRAGDNMKVMGDNFIRNSVKYMGAIQGGLFILNNVNGKAALSLISAFAYDRKKFLQKNLEVGEGLVGTCAIEKNTIHLTEIPEGYISITSGLGDTPPDNLLLVPVINEDELLGVMEISSLKKFSDYEITFAEEVAKSLGATIVYTRNNEMTSSLLTKSQRQAQEMAEQEEEMRQNMEELKATQEESQRREEEYHGILEAVQKSVFIMEYSPSDAKITGINDKFCELLGVKKNSVIGKDHQQISGGSLKVDRDFLEKACSGKTAVFTEIFEIKGKKVTLQEHFAPVINQDGVVIKYINFAFAPTRLVSENIMA